MTGGGGVSSYGAGGGYGLAAPPPSSASAPVKGSSIWSWKDDYAWKQYDGPTCNQLENACVVLKAKSVLLSQGFFMTRRNYVVRFGPKGIFQENTRTKFRRQVRRSDWSGMQYTPSEIKQAVAKAAKAKGGGGVGGGGVSSGRAPAPAGPTMMKPYVAPKPGSLPMVFPSNASGGGGGGGIGSFFGFGSSSNASKKKNSTSIPSLLPKGKRLKFNGKKYRLGRGAASLGETKSGAGASSSEIAQAPTALSNPPQQIQQMLKESVKGVDSMRGQRGQRSVTEMLQACYQQGLFMHGGPTSPVNSLVVPAIRYVFGWCSQAKPSDPKRSHILNTLADACLDCQQVQAREILRLYRELTNQHQTLPKQIFSFLDSFRESAIDAMITRYHSPKCDQDHTKSRPHEQRAHLRSAYVVLAGSHMGMRDILPSKNDRFLYKAQSEVESKLPTTDGGSLASELLGSIDVQAFVMALLTDINNQSKTADRSIDRKCIFNWAGKNLDDPHAVFYNDENKEDYADLTPNKPTSDNEYEPFLSLKVLVKILLKLHILDIELTKRRDLNDDDEDEEKAKPGKDSKELGMDFDTVLQEKQKAQKFAQQLKSIKVRGKTMKDGSIDLLLKHNLTVPKFKTMTKRDFLNLGMTAGESVLAGKVATVMLKADKS